MLESTQVKCEKGKDYLLSYRSLGTLSGWATQICGVIDGNYLMYARLPEGQGREWAFSRCFKWFLRQSNDMSVERGEMPLQLRWDAAQVQKGDKWM